MHAIGITYEFVYVLVFHYLNTGWYSYCTSFQNSVPDVCITFIRLNFISSLRMSVIHTIIIVCQQCTPFCWRCVVLLPLSATIIFESIYLSSTALSGSWARSRDLFVFKLRCLPLIQASFTSLRLIFITLQTWCMQPLSYKTHIVAVMISWFLTYLSLINLGGRCLICLRYMTGKRPWLWSGIGQEYDLNWSPGSGPETGLELGP